MSYSGVVLKASRCLHTSLVRPLPRRVDTLFRAGTPLLPLHPSKNASRCYSQPTRRPSRPPTLNRDDLDVFASRVCKDESQHSFEIVLRLTSSVHTLDSFHRVCVTLMEAFASQGKIDVADRILRIAHEQFGLRVNKGVHAIILQALLASGHIQEALEWLQDGQNKPGPGAANAHQWNEFFAACLSHKRHDLFREAVDFLKTKDVVKPDARMEHLLREYETRGLAQPKPVDKSGPISEPKVAAMIAEQLAERGEKSARSLLHSVLREGFQPTFLTLEVVAAHLSTAQSLHTWEQELSLVASRHVWTVVLRNAAETQPVDVAVSAYQVFLKRGLVPTPAIMHPILRAICSVSLRLPSEDDIRLALSLHREYVSLAKRDASSQSDDLPLYNTLIRAIVSSNKTTFYPDAVSLLEEARARGIVTDAMTTASFITLLMRIAPDSDSAWKVYQILSKHPNGDWSLDGPGFRSVLDAFSRHCFAKPSHYLSYNRIVRDMHTAGHAVSLENYTLLLRHLSTLAGRLRDDPEEFRDLAAVIRRVHNALTIEPSIHPDTILWNQLMDTYQRAGCFREALTVWEPLFISGKYDNASVSIIIDTCAFADEHGLVAQIFAKLYSAKYPLNQKNWHNWIEGLARIGRVEEATKILCLAMPREGVQPTKEIVRTLITFAGRQNMESEVRYRIKTYLPKLYKQLYP